MATALKLRRGTTAQHSAFTGELAEVTVDTDKDTVVVHDGSTAGGFPLAKANGSAINPTSVGATTAGTGAFTTLSASSTVSGTGFSNYLASPPAIGGTAAAAVSSTNLAYTGTLTGGTGVISIGTNQIYKDASGNVGIGTSSPTVKLTVSATGSDHQLRVQNTGTSASDDAIIQISTSSTGATSTISGFYFGDADSSSSGQQRYNHSDDSMTFYTVSTEKMRILSGGEVAIGKTVNTATGAGIVLDDAGLIRITRDGTTSSTQMQFNNNGGTAVGTITTSGSATAYNTSSDYRLKENVLPMTGALEKVAALKPVTYTWKSSGEAGQGFIAHELQAVVPDCVTGEKDAVETVDDLDADGKKIGTKEVPRYQGVDTSFLVATLVAAIQEQQATIAAMETRLAALEA